MEMKVVMCQGDMEQLTELVRIAAGGDTRGLERVSAAVRPMLEAFLLRSTLDKTLTDELVQETLMQMVKSIATLERPESFRSWLFRIATNKLYEHRRRRVPMNFSRLGESAESMMEEMSDGKASYGAAAMCQKELAQAALDAMAALKEVQRQIVSLRCFEDLSFGEIAESVGCSETQARTTFFRARKTLETQLRKRGFGAAMLAGAIGIFGQATTPAGASITFSAGSVSAAIREPAVSGLKLLLASTSAKIWSMAAVGVVLIGSSVLYFGAGGFGGDGATGAVRRSDIKGFHYILQGWDNTSPHNTNLTYGKSLSKGAYEQWHYFPEGVDGPMFMAMQRWDPSMKTKLCGWLQDGSGNYYYHSGQNKIYIYNNHLPLGSMLTRRLPTDSAGLTEFIDMMEGKPEGLRYERDGKTGLITGATDDRFYNAKDFRTAINYNTANSEPPGFRFPWPADAARVDERDAMHWRGWTCFRMRGMLGAFEVRGKGRMPFVYDAMRTASPAMILNIDSNMKKIRVVDSGAGASVTVNGEPARSRAVGSFFKGLARPWMGMHTMDIVRRDAAENRIPFKTGKLRTSEKGDLVEVSLEEKGADAVKIVYTIELDRDVIDKIEIFSASGNDGVLFFEYPDEIDELAGQISEELAGQKRVRGRAVKDDGIDWLFDMAKGKFGEK